MLKRLLRNKRIATALLVLCLGMAIVGAYELWQFRQATVSAPDPMVIAVTDDKPSEAAIDPKSEYNVPAEHPRRIILPTISTEGFVQQVGLTKEGSVGVPTNINLAGWFMLKARPGDEGVSLIDGHVQGQYHPGIFKHLERLKVGDKFGVESGDLSLRRFEVVSVTSYSANEVAKHMFEKRPGIDKQLNLITCSGRYNSETQQYENRLLVVSKRIE